MTHNNNKTIIEASVNFKEARDKHIEREYGLRPITPNHRAYIDTVNTNVLTLCSGPAGTGKSYIATGMAASMVSQERYERILMFRPPEETGKKMGHLPGDLSEKVAPYYDGLIDIMEEHLGKETCKKWMDSGVIESKVIGFQRGVTFKNCCVILDEAQNTDIITMKMFLTRIGENCKVIVNGDIDQKDIKGKSGLQDALERLHGVKDIGILHLSEEDCVRSELVKAILERYR